MTGAWQLSIGTSTFRRLDAELRQFFARRVRPGFDPRDLASDVWVSAGRLFQGRASLRHYLFIVARSTLAEHWRRQDRRPELVELDEEIPASMPGLETELTELSEHASLREAVSELEPHYRAVVELKLQGVDNYQIGRELGIPYNTVRSRLSRGIAQLRELLAV